MRKGFSLIALVTTVAIILILASTATFSVINSSNVAKKTSFATEINMVQEAVDAYKTKNNAYPTGDIIIADLSSLNDKQKEQFSLNGENIVSNKVSLSKIDYQKLSLTTLKFGTSNSVNDVYAVSELTGKVYYVKGFEVGTDVFFTLTEPLRNLLSVNQDKNLTNAGAPVIFEPSEIGFSALNINVKVKVPSTYTNISVYANDTAVPMSGVENGFNIYNVSGKGNYTVTVNYNEKTSTYNVTTVDKGSPTFTISDYTEIVEPEDDIIGYYKITSKEDNLSGIRYIKYEEELFEDFDFMLEHFEVSGIEVKDDIIPVRKGVKALTVYVEDNVGNWSVQYIER